MTGSCDVDPLGGPHGFIDAAFARALAAVEAGRIPGAALGVVTLQGSAVRFAGAAQLVPERVPLARDTWFDLASLTKVIVTTTEILRLVEEGLAELDDPLSRHLPDLRQYDVAGAPERRLTLRQCLAHQTFLPAVEPLYTYGQDPATLRAFVLQREWRHGPPVYSDINFILLGLVLERLRGRPLSATPLAGGLGFSPDPLSTAATEACTWRGRTLRGEVHDENAFALGGAAGHAGLFGTVDGVLAFARGLLDGTTLSDVSSRAIRTRVAGNRTVGWEVAHPGWTGGGRCDPEASIGHTGFTGTGLWLDFSRGLAWTLLTNRVHPSRHVETGIQALRRETGERVVAGFEAADIPVSRGR